MSAEKKHYTEQEIIAQFRDAMAGACLRTSDDIIADGELQRFYVEGDAKGSRNGFYVLYTDGDTPAGYFGSWKGGQEQTWCIRREGKLDPEEYKAAMKRIAENKERRKAQEAAKHKETAQTAASIWEAATECDDHPYLERKRVRSHGLRIGKWTNGQPALLVPMFDTEGCITSLQAIFANKNPVIGRDKDFLKDGKKRGSFFTLGSQPVGYGATILIGEGYSTCAALHESTGHTVRMAFDAYNLRNVAIATRKEYPSAQIVICADNDRWTLQPIENPGVTKARDASIACAGVLCIPEFSDLSDRPTDFNDLFVMEGAAAVRAQITAAIPEAANDNFVSIEANLNIFEFPHRNASNQQPQDTPHNLAHMFKEYGIKCRYNEISKEIEIDIPGTNYSRANKSTAEAAEIGGLCVRNGLSKASLDANITWIAQSNTYNPAREWVESREWDGQDRITRLAATIDSPDGALAEILIRRWMIGAIGCLYEKNGMSMQGAIVLQGAQNVGKTTWFWSLLGENRHLGKEGASLDPTDRDSVKPAISYWLVELGELDATFNKSDIAALKSFITKDADEIFLRYSRKSSIFERRTAFLGTVNPEHFLHDDTGNRRFWTIRCGSKMIALHGIDMQQAWAQAKHLYASGEQHRLKPSELEMLNASNDTHMETNPVEELIRTRFDWDGGEACRMTATDILIKIGYDKPTNQQSKAAGKALRKLAGEPVKSNGKQVFKMPRFISRSFDGARDFDGMEPPL